MAKIQGEIKISDNVIKFKGIKNKNHLIFKENDILVIIDIFNNKVIMKRCTDDYDVLISLILNKTTENKYNIKNVGSVVIKIKTLNLVISEDSIKIKYLVVDSNETFNYQINWRN